MAELPNRELNPTELRQLIESNARSIQSLAAENRETLRAVYRLAGLMERFFEQQIGTNADLDQRISRMEGTIE